VEAVLCYRGVMGGGAFGEEWGRGVKDSILWGE